RGSVIPIFSATSTLGIDLTVGDTSIHTSTGGQFAFPNAHAGEDMRINHPLLKRAMYWRLADMPMPMVLPFDLGLYNALPEQANVITAIYPDETKQLVEVDVLQEAKNITYTITYKDGVWTL